MFHMGNKDSWIKTMPKLLIKIINCSPQFKVIQKIRGLDHRQIVALDNIHVHIGLVANQFIQKPKSSAQNRKQLGKLIYNNM